jgi:hypothetical protein
VSSAEPRLEAVALQRDSPPRTGFCLQPAVKPSRLWDPSHMGLLAECPHRQRKTFVASLMTVPSLASTVQAPSTSRGPSFKAVILTLMCSI